MPHVSCACLWQVEDEEDAVAAAYRVLQEEDRAPPFPEASEESPLKKKSEAKRMKKGGFAQDKAMWHVRGNTKWNV
jgi:hypothetical protein